MSAIYAVRLSDHFFAREFRCRGEDEGQPCACHGAVQVDERLVDILEMFRAIDGMPLIITSGFRCDPYNDSVGGHPRSFHRYGMAADITNHVVRDNLEDSAEDIGDIIVQYLGTESGNVIWYPDRNIVHVDVGSRVADLVRKTDE